MKTLIHFNNFVKEINENNGRLYKQSVLNKYKDDEIVKRYLQIAFDPYKVYGISTKKLNKIVGGYGITGVESVFDLFDYLEVHNTGSDADVSICQEVLNNVCTYDRECGALLEALICKDLSIGCDAKTINKEIPDLIPTFSVQLANKYFDKPQYVEGKEFAITTKIDGGRIIAIKENNQVSFYTRAGQKYEGLVEIERTINFTMPNGIVLDGELTIYDYKNYSSKDAYKQAMKISRTDGEKKGLKMLVFDAMPLEDFRSQNCRFTWSQRRKELENLFNLFPLKDVVWPVEFIELLPVLYQGTDTAMITKLLDSELARGQEGIMINLCDAKYEFKRTNNLLKVKKFSSLDLEVIDVEEGFGRLAGTLGAIHVKYKDGNTVKVGSGFSDNERKLFWNSPDLIINKIVEIKYFEESSNADGTFSLRFPVWCSNIRIDKLEPDF